MQASLIDRLLNESLPGDAGRGFSAHEIRKSISTDLENLLNTRSEGARLIPQAFKECRASSLTYGILDFSSYSILSPHDRDQVRRSLEQTIAQHEGRLSRVRVTLEPQRPDDRALRFKVDAMLDLGDENEKVQFDAVLQVSTQVCSVR